MRKTLSLFLISACTLVGCNVQHGRYVTTSCDSNSFLSPVGSIDIVDGYERAAGVLNEQHLLYILIVVPGVQENGSGSRDDYGKYVTTLSHSWNTVKGTLAVSILWNRQTDIVIVGKQEFIRAKGDVFVVRLNPTGEVLGQQFANLGSHARYQDVLQYIQLQLPNDGLIASIKLYK